MKKLSNKSILRNVAILTVLFGGLSFYSFNCAPSSFVVADSASLSLSSNGEIITGDNGPSLDVKVVAPQALLTSEQIFESLLNVTGQKATVTNGQIQEFERRAGSFGASSQLDKVNAPMMIALTSFSGEVCNGLVQREQGQPADQRKYFQGVNFGAAIAMFSDVAYEESVTRMTNSFLGRAPSSEEITLFKQFRSEFIAAIPAANIGQNAQTRALALSTCTALLSSFDVYTY